MVFSKDFIGEEVFAFGLYEKHEIKTIANVINDQTSQGAVLDIGANIGNHAVQFSRLFKKVLCFEPNALIFDILKLNTRHKTNIDCYNVGLSNEEKTAYLEIPEKNFGGATVSNSNSIKSIAIELKKGDHVIAEPFSFMKMDVEGHELNVLEGMEKLIKQNKPIICFELINKDASSLEIISVLKKMGYDTFYIPYSKSFFSTSKKKRYYQSFLDGLLFKVSYQLVREFNFEKPFYNLIFCEHLDSSFRIKEEAIKK